MHLTKKHRLLFSKNMKSKLIELVNHLHCYEDDEIHQMGQFSLASKVDREIDRRKRTKEGSRTRMKALIGKTVRLCLIITLLSTLRSC